MTSQKHDENAWKLFRRYGNLGTEMVVAVFIGAAGGRALDQWFDVKPLFFIVGFIFGAAAGFLSIYRLITSKHLTQGKQPIKEKEDEKN